MTCLIDKTGYLRGSLVDRAMCGRVYETEARGSATTRQSRKATCPSCKATKLFADVRRVAVRRTVR